MRSSRQIDSSCSPRCSGLARAMLVASAAILGATASSGAEQPYPFEGTWVRADRICSASSPNTRTYTAREVVFPSGHCMLRKVAFGSGEWELFEDCHRPEHQGNIREKIRMLGPDTILVKRQVVRLKIPHGRRFARCSLAAPQKPAPGGRSFGVGPNQRHTAPGPRRGDEREGPGAKPEAPPE